MDLRKCDISALIKCDDKDCGGVTFKYAFEKNGWHCPFCGKSISKSDGQPTLSPNSLLAQWLSNGFKQRSE